VYERGVAALQRRDFVASAERFREVLERYPEERELHERARLYLRVCERELQRLEPTPQTLEERIYAATLALNAGADADALAHLTRALAEDAENANVHYMLAVVHARRGDPASSVAHLRHAVELDGETRALARRDPDFDILRADEGFRQIVDAHTASGARRRARSRLVR
jgi:tetratricopeptide (TPR) repeat protein